MVAWFSAETFQFDDVVSEQFYWWRKMEYPDKTISISMKNLYHRVVSSTHRYYFESRRELATLQCQCGDRQWFIPVLHFWKPMEIQQDTIENEHNSHIFLIVKTCNCRLLSKLEKGLMLMFINIYLYFCFKQACLNPWYKY